MDGEQFQQQIQPPQFVLEQKRSRAMLPKLASYLALGVVFYLLIVLNISYLEVSEEVEELTLFVSLWIIIILIFIGTLESLLASYEKYEFFLDHIERRAKKVKNSIQLAEVQPQGITQKRTFWDKLFKTYQLVLSRKFAIRNIPEEKQVQSYVLQLVNYAHAASATYAQQQAQQMR